MARLLVLFVAIVAAWALAEAQAPPCREVAQMISPCLSYLAGRTTMPYGPCCSGVAALNRTALSVPDRASLCRCLKSIAPRLPILNLARAAVLPSACGLNLNVTISPSLDCAGLSYLPPTTVNP